MCLLEHPDFTITKTDRVGSLYEIIPSDVVDYGRSCGHDNSNNPTATSLSLSIFSLLEPTLKKWLPRLICPTQ
jgi:hypothetical protein